MIILFHILAKVFIDISIRIHSIFESDGIPINSSIVCVFDGVIFVTASDIIPRISHCQSVNSIRECFISGSSFRGGLNFIKKLSGLFSPVFSLFIEEICIALSIFICAIYIFSINHLTVFL